MTAFVRALGVDTNGRNLRTLKDQLGRLAAATIRLAVVEDGRAMQINGQVIGAFDLWFPPDADQRVLWPTTVRLSADYFASLAQHAVPLDSRAVAALAPSAMALDVYTWLAPRLHRMPKDKPQLTT
jgi:Plasmid encoded RepA protein